ncbi:nuclease-related domain-containing protein [Bacillus massilinigeriensis]|uniref:nuclease-related domain-containing protein n=1 Tax=Bacillus mediterraneensis TaxID=1805474 RepID=UPI0008F8A8D0|nr:nuclease-related domain-containing protein [Bacillus mediterraneensis]
MIVKPRYLPMRLHVNSALAQRLAKNHPILPSLDNSSSRVEAGFQGEVETDFQLQFLNDKEHHIFRDLRLPHSLHPFQLDCLILSTKAIIHLEVKNFTGTLFFDEKFKQFYQTANAVEKGFQHPLTQLRRQSAQLKEWLDSHGFPSIPVISQLVISNSSAVVKTNDFSIRRLVCKADQLKTQLETLIGKDTPEVLKEKELRKLSRLLLKEHTIMISDILAHYHISYDELIKGVQCPSCEKYKMERKNRTWVCPHCLFHSRDAHIRALLDYFLLVKPEITNRGFREFTCLSSARTATELLSRLNLPHTGENKWRVYYAPPDVQAILEEKWKNSRNRLRSFIRR